MLEGVEENDIFLGKGIIDLASGQINHLLSMKNQTECESLPIPCKQQVEEDESEECLELCNECLIKAVKKFPSQFLELCHEMDELKVNASFNDAIKVAFAQATDKVDIKNET